LPDPFSRFSLDGEVAVVTGAARGIGESTALVLAAAGARVVAADKDADGADRTARRISAAGGEAVACVVDIGSREAVDDMIATAVQAFGQLDILCNIAGVGYSNPVVDVPAADLDRLIDVNMKGVFFACQAALRQMIPRRHGSIINVASSAIDYPVAGYSVYGMTKAAVVYLSRVLADEVGPLGIRVNVIAPGSTATDFRRYRLDLEAETAFRDRISATVPLRAVGEPIDQAMLVLYLVSPAAKWATGNVWRANGGIVRMG
jgi:3-oxoacyl-[acyl-carrier protein] reductase